MKNIIYNVIVSLLSGIGIFFIASGVDQKIRYGDSSIAFWQFDPLPIGIGAAFIVGAVLLYKCKK